ncbi:YczE/YyaS/YitT family protein [Paenibacillus tuaregi]|uniref:YczE/YyaS/YitT family protein n=1 Tax=Paenibacillus tuaregi TaxID=1816681 RepID=UPI0008384EF4
MKIFIFGVGIFILTFGVSLTIQSDLGVSPFDAMLVGLSNSIGLTVGSWEVIIAMIIIGCNSYFSKQRPELLGLVTAFITGIGIDFWLFLFDHAIEPKLLLSKIVCYTIGLFFVALGTSIYLTPNFAPIPIDRLTLILHTRSGLNLFITRTLIYLFFLTVAFAVKGPIGIGTIVTVCLGGILLNKLLPFTQKQLGKLKKMETTT